MEIENLTGGNDAILRGKKSVTTNFYIKQIRSNFSDYIRNYSGGNSTLYFGFYDKFYSSSSYNAAIQLDWAEVWVIAGNNYVEITQPNATNVLTTKPYQNITIQFKFYEDSIPLVVGITVNSLKINGMVCTLVGIANYITDHWEQNCTAPNLNSGDTTFTLEISASSPTDTHISEALNSIYYQALQITQPNATNVLTTDYGENHTMKFEFYEAGIEITAGLSVINITFNNYICILQGNAYRDSNVWNQNCTSPDLIDGNYNLTIIANTSTSGLKSDTEINAITYSTATISFTVFTLGGGGNFTTSMITSYGNSTEAYYYNATGLYSPLVKPCANANAVTYCQNGMNTPQYSVINTGNTQFKFYMKLNQPLAVNNVKLCANSSGSGGTSNTLATCVFGAGASDEGNLNGTSWLFLGDVPASGNARLNITSYMNFSYVLKGEWSNIIYMNTTT
jgi:hypothetical protein